jgi:energy-coupling factor transport system ATP-binding protein
MIRIIGLRHRLVKIPALDVDARHVAVIGPNGSGKTTLLNLCAGMEEPDEGSILLAGRRPSEIRIGWVGEFPDRTLLFSRVYDEIASSPRFRHRPCRETHERVIITAEAIGVSHLLEKSVSDLSGGEKVLVALAAACADDPEVLILDEVDSHLDEETTQRIRRAVQNSTALHLLWCTQAMDIASEADCVLYLRNGTVQHCGAPEDVFEKLENTCFYPSLWRVGR